MPLYKYCRPERIDIIQNLKIRFSPQSALNDPFDCISDTALLDNSQWVSEIINDVAVELATGEAIQAAFERRPSRLTLEAAKVVGEKRYRENPGKYKKAFIGIHRQGIEKNFRILSLTRVPPDDPKALLLWGHYATDKKGHDGIVIEFDETHPWILAHNRGPLSRCDADGMFYGKKRATYDSQKPLREIIFTKSEHWSYEDEFRLIRTIGDPAFETDKVDALVKFDASVLSTVTLGAGASDRSEEDLKKIIRSNPALSKLKLRRAETHPDEYKLRLIDIT